MTSVCLIWISVPVTKFAVHLAVIKMHEALVSDEGQCKAFNLKINFIFVQIYSVSQDRSYTKPHFESKGVKNLLKI